MCSSVCDDVTEFEVREFTEKNLISWETVLSSNKKISFIIHKGL